MTNVNLIDRDKFFPEVDHRFKPLGNQVLIQGVYLEEKAGSIFIPEEVRRQEAYDIKFGKVVALGPLAFRNRETGEDWKEGKWVDIGDLAFIQRSGHRLNRVINDKLYSFVLINDTDCSGATDSLDGMPFFQKY